MMTMMQRWACQRRHNQSTVHSIIDIDQNEARTDSRWVSLKHTKKSHSMLSRKAYLNYIGTYLPTYLT